jgi:hypothetical protein
MALTVLTTEIPPNESLSNPLMCQGAGRIVRIGMPSDWTSAPLTFQVSRDNETYRDLYHAMQSTQGEWVPYEATVPSVVPNSILLLPPGAGSDLGWLRLRSGTRQMPVVQAERGQFMFVFD